jgi:hypothetical protein
LEHSGGGPGGRLSQMVTHHAGDSRIRRDPLVHLGKGALSSIFCYTTKIMDNLKTRTENRCNSIDLLLNERPAQFFSLAHTQNLEQSQINIPRQNCVLVCRRRSGNWVGTCLNAPTPRARRSDRGAPVRGVRKGETITSVNYMISRC